METSKNSTRQLTLDELILSQEGFPASPTQSQDYKEATKTNATCGRRCCALFENAPRATSWAKTFSALLVGMEGWCSRRCALTWKLKGTPSNRMYFQLRASTLPTEDIESGLLPTPRTVDVEGGAVSNVKNDGKGWYRENAKGERWGVKLRDVAELGTSSQLSPLFAEEMMGFPKNWTASPFQSGDEKASKPTGTPLSLK